MAQKTHMTAHMGPRMMTYDTEDMYDDMWGHIWRLMEQRTRMTARVGTRMKTYNTMTRMTERVGAHDDI